MDIFLEMKGKKWAVRARQHATHLANDGQLESRNSNSIAFYLVCVSITGHESAA